MSEGTECASCERFLAQPWLAELVVPKTHFGVVRLASKTVKNSLNVLGPTSVTFAQDVDLSRFYLPVPGRSSQGHGISLSRVRSIRVLSGFPPHHVESLCCMLPQLGVLQHLAVHWTHADAVCGRLEELRDLRGFCGDFSAGPRAAPPATTLLSLSHALRRCPRLASVRLAWEGEGREGGGVPAGAREFLGGLMSDAGVAHAVRLACVVAFIQAGEALGALPAAARDLDPALFRIGELMAEAGAQSRGVLATVVGRGPPEDTSLLRAALAHFPLHPLALHQVEGVVAGPRAPALLLRLLLRHIAHLPGLGQGRRGLLGRMVERRSRAMLAAIPGTTPQYRAARELAAALLADEVRSESLVCDLVKACPRHRLRAVLQTALALGLVSPPGLAHALAFSALRRTFGATAAALAEEGPALLSRARGQGVSSWARTRFLAAAVAAVAAAGGGGGEEEGAERREAVRRLQALASPLPLPAPLPPPPTPPVLALPRRALSREGAQRREEAGEEGGAGGERGARGRRGGQEHAASPERPEQRRQAEQQGGGGGGRGGAVRAEALTHPCTSDTPVYHS